MCRGPFRSDGSGTKGFSAVFGRCACIHPFVTTEKRSSSWSTKHSGNYKEILFWFGFRNLAYFFLTLDFSSFLQFPPATSWQHFIDIDLMEIVLERSVWVFIQLPGQGEGDAEIPYPGFPDLDECADGIREILDDMG